MKESYKPTSSLYLWTKYHFDVPEKLDLHLKLNPDLLFLCATLWLLRVTL